MTLSFVTDKNNDLYLGLDGNIAMNRDIQAVLQVCKNDSQTMLGECVLDVERGLPNFSVIWSGPPNLPQLETALRQVLLSVEGVVEIVSLVVDLLADELRYIATIRTIYGVGDING